MQGLVRSTALLAMAMLVMYDALWPRFQPYQKELQAGFLAFALISSVALTLLARRGPTIRTYEVVGILLVGLGCVGLIQQDRIFWVWVVGDILLIAGPVAFYTLWRRCGTFIGGRLAEVFIASLLLAPLVAMNFPDPTDGNRFAPPEELAIALVAWKFVTSPSQRKWLWLLGFIGIAALAWFSQWRGPVVGAALALILALWIRRKIAGALVVLLMAGILAASLLPGSVIHGIDRVLQDSRFRTLLEGGATADKSIAFRFVEAEAVLRQVKTEWGTLSYLFGSGHGATFRYEPIALFASERYEESNVKDGRVHNVHIAPIGFLYRYGIFGVGVFLAFSILIVMCLRKVRNTMPVRMDVAVPLIAAAIYLAEFVLYNVANEILFAPTIGAALLAAELLKNQCEAAPRTDRILGNPIFLTQSPRLGKSA